MTEEGKTTVGGVKNEKRVRLFLVTVGGNSEVKYKHLKLPLWSFPHKGESGGRVGEDF